MRESALPARKVEEIEFHNALRDPALVHDPARHRRLTANRKYYSAAGSSMRRYQELLAERCRGKRVLDFGCGDGTYSLFLAESGAAEVVGIDISDVSVENCRRRATEAGCADRVTFEVMDGEDLRFPDRSFDLVCEAGVLHHVSFPRAIAEIARVLRPDGSAVAYEALGHNPFFQAYRRLTPQLRTRYETEHILRRRDLEAARRRFRTLEVSFHHLASLLAVPFRRLPFFPGLLRALERVDETILRWPLLRSQAWMMIFELTGPLPAEPAEPIR